MTTSMIGSPRNVLVPWTKQAAEKLPTIVRGSGSFIIDDAGKRYMDLSAGLVAVNLGHGHPKVVKAIQDQAERLCFVSPAFGNDVRNGFAQWLSDNGPWDEGARTFFTTGGGEANEDAMKIARMLTGKHKVLSAYRSFHGSAPGAGTLTGEDRRWANEPGLPGVVHFFTPYPYRSPFDSDTEETEVRRALAHLETVLTFEGPRNVAALFIEPVVGTNGVIVYPEGYLRGVREICDKYGVLLVFDEVMTGFGRLGDTFAANAFGVAPDLLTIAKGASSAYVPLGGVLIRETLACEFDERPLMCGHTYAGHPLTVAAGLATVRALEDEGLFSRGKQIESWLADGLGELEDRHDVVGDVRGLGAFFGVELVRDRSTKEPLVPWYGGDNRPIASFAKAMREEGVYVFGRYNVLVIAPPLTVEREELDLAFEALDKCLPMLS